MEVMVEKCCGVDVSSENDCMLAGSLDINRPKKFQKVLGTRTQELRDTLEWLTEHEVTDIFIESTGQYWVPTFNIFPKGKFNMILANSEHIKNVPGRETMLKMRNGLHNSDVMACGHKFLRVIYKTLSDKVPYDEKRVLGLRQQRLALIKNIF